MKRSAFPVIRDENQHLSFGGSQHWYPKRSARAGGCGPVAAANALAAASALTALENGEKGLHRALYDGCEHPVFERSSYLSLMESVYRYMPSPMMLKHAFGITMAGYAFGLALYGRRVRKPLHVEVLPCGFADRKKALAFIRTGLEQSGAVTLLVAKRAVTVTLIEAGRPRVVKTKSHFMTITDMEEDEDGSIRLTLSTWGSPATMSFDELVRSWRSPLAFGTSMAYLVRRKHVFLAAEAVRAGLLMGRFFVHLLPPIRQS